MFFKVKEREKKNIVGASSCMEGYTHFTIVKRAARRIKHHLEMWFSAIKRCRTRHQKTRVPPTRQQVFFIFNLIYANIEVLMTTPKQY